MTEFMNSNGLVYMLTYCNLLDCFVPRNDGGGYRNDGIRYRHCEPAKQSSKNIHSL